jgi:hypothetical protein
VGSGWGSEVLWALKRGAAFVVGVDPNRARHGGPRRPLHAASGDGTDPG